MGFHRLRWAAVLSAGLVAAGCGTMMLGQVRDAPVTNWLPLHAGVRSGDYAVYEDFGGRQRMRLEAVAVRDGLIEIVATWPRPPAPAMFLKDFEYHLRAAADGTVREAFLRDRRGGRDLPLKVAGPGDANYVPERRSVALPRAERVETPAGRFEVREIVAFEQKMSNALVDMEATSIYYLHPDAKFGLVRQQHAVRADVPLVELVRFVSSVSPVSAVQSWLTDWILSKARNPESVNGMNLVEQG